LNFNPKIEMKNLILSALLVLCGYLVSAQETYKINGESYELKKEVSGTIDLLWNIIDNEYRYFVNNEEYLATLKSVTSDASASITYDDVKLLLYSLKDFTNSYNSAVDANYVYDKNKIYVKTRLGFFGGITNNPFIGNPDNVTSTTASVEFELYDDDFAKRHGAFVGIEHVFENDKINYSLTEASLGYRYRFIYQKAFNIYANVKLATYRIAKFDVELVNINTQETRTKKVTTNSFDAPIIFGLGADIKVGENGFLVLSYDELFAVFFSSPDNFSRNISLGYKFNL